MREGGGTERMMRGGGGRMGVMKKGGKEGQRRGRKEVENGSDKG